MNKNDFRAKAYGVGKTNNKNDSTADNADDIKAKDLTQNKPSSSQELEESVSFLKNGRNPIRATVSASSPGQVISVIIILTPLYIIRRKISRGFVKFKGMKRKKHVPVRRAVRSYAPPCEPHNLPLLGKGDRLRWMRRTPFSPL